MATDVAHLQACRMRLTRLDADGGPTVGAQKAYVTDVLVSVAVSPQYEEGAETTEKNACDAVVIQYKGPDSYKGDDLTITLSSPDPIVTSFLTGESPIVDGGEPTQIGAESPAVGQLSSASVSIELWVKRAGTSGALESDFPYARYVYPRVQNLRRGDYTHDVNTVKPVFTGRAVENTEWGDGGLNDWDWSSDKTMQWMPVDEALPTKGYQTVLADA